MTVENSNSVDGMGISKADGKVVLTISDHLDWDNEQHHFNLLEKKIGAYLAFVKSGQLQEAQPKAIGRAVRIELIYQHEPSTLASRFLSAAKQQLHADGLEFSYRGLPAAH